jgi:hypothetical protein
VDDGAITQIRASRWLGGGPRLLVLSVDDAPSPADELGLRQCEVRQLSGDAAARCVDGSAALDVGWCSERSKFYPQDVFAWTRDAFPTDQLATIDVLCNLER